MTHINKSSANACDRNLSRGCKTLSRSSINTKKRVEEMGDPWGTPHDVAISAEWFPTIKTEVLPSKYDRTQQSK